MISFFISSTFKDMRKERDILHNAVFPKLRQKVLSRGEDIQEIDLRWGVDTSRMSEEKSSRYVITSCLDTIDRCRPYIIVLIGERYGWIPDELTIKRIGDTALEDLFAGGISITNAEILYGALQEGAAPDRCIFCFRDPEFSALVPEEKRGDYATESEEHAARLFALKQRILSSGGKVIHYRAVWDPETGAPSGLDDFEETLQNELWDMISPDLPDEPQKLLPEGRILREADHTRKRYIRDYVERGFVSTYGRDSVWVYGEAGSGKSALISQEATRGILLDYPVFLYYGENPDCGSSLHFLRTLLYWMYLRLEKNSLSAPQKGEAGKGEPPIPQIPELPQDRPELLRQIQAVSGQLEELYFFIDAPEAMDEGIFPALLFLRQSVIGSRRGRTMMVASSDKYYHSKQGIQGLFLIREQRELNEKDRRSLIRAHAAYRRKGVDQDVENTILQKAGSGNPRYLTLVLDRLFMMDQRDFEASDTMGTGMTALTAFMKQIVENLPDQTPALGAFLINHMIECLGQDLAEIKQLPKDRISGDGAFSVLILRALSLSEKGLSVRGLEQVLSAEGWNIPTALPERLFGALSELFRTDSEGRWQIAEGSLFQRYRAEMTEEELVRLSGILASTTADEAEKIRFLSFTGLTEEIPFDVFEEIVRNADAGSGAFAALLERIPGKLSEGTARMIIENADRLTISPSLLRLAKHRAETADGTEPYRYLSALKDIAWFELLKSDPDRELPRICGSRVLAFFREQENIMKAGTDGLILLARMLVPALCHFKYAKLKPEAYLTVQAVCRLLEEQALWEDKACMKKCSDTAGENDVTRPENELLLLYTAMRDWADLMRQKPSRKVGKEALAAWLQTVEEAITAIPDGIETLQRVFASQALFKAWRLIWLGQELVVYGRYGAGINGIQKGMAVLEDAAKAADPGTIAYAFWYHYLLAQANEWMVKAVVQTAEKKYMIRQEDHSERQYMLYPCEESLSNLAWIRYQLAQKSEDESEGKVSQNALKNYRSIQTLYEGYWAFNGKSLDTAAYDDAGVFAAACFALVKPLLIRTDAANDGKELNTRQLKQWLETLEQLEKRFTGTPAFSMISEALFETARYYIYTGKEGAKELLKRAKDADKAWLTSDPEAADQVFTHSLVYLELPEELPETERMFWTVTAQDCLAKITNPDAEKQLALARVMAAAGDAAAAEKVQAALAQTEENSLKKVLLLAAELAYRNASGSAAETEQLLPLAAAVQGFLAAHINGSELKKRETWYTLRTILNQILAALHRCYSPALNADPQKLLTAEDIGKDPAERAAAVTLISQLQRALQTCFLLYSGADIPAIDSEGCTDLGVLSYLLEPAADHPPLQSLAAVKLEKMNGGKTRTEKKLYAKYALGELFQDEAGGNGVSLRDLLLQLFSLCRENDFAEECAQARLRLFAFLYLEGCQTEYFPDLEERESLCASLRELFATKPVWADALEKKANGYFPASKDEGHLFQGEYLAWCLLQAKDRIRQMQESGFLPSDENHLTADLNSLERLCRIYQYLSAPLKKWEGGREMQIALQMAETAAAYIRALLNVWKNGDKSGDREKDSRCAFFETRRDEIGKALSQAALVCSRTFLQEASKGRSRSKQKLPEFMQILPEAADYLLDKGVIRYAYSIWYTYLYALGEAAEPDVWPAPDILTDLLKKKASNIPEEYAQGRSMNGMLDYITQIGDHFLLPYYEHTERIDVLEAFADYIEDLGDYYLSSVYDQTYKGLHIYSNVLRHLLFVLTLIHKKLRMETAKAWDETSGNGSKRLEIVEKRMLHIIRGYLDLCDTAIKRIEADVLSEYTEYLMEEGTTSRREAAALLEEARRYSGKNAGLMAAAMHVAAEESDGKGILNSAKDIPDGGVSAYENELDRVLKN